MIIIGIVGLLLACGFAGFGMWAGWTIAVETCGNEEARRTAYAVRDAYEQGFVAGMAAWVLPAPPERPYDIEADR